jgi:hypothetical protein
MRHSTSIITDDSIGKSKVGGVACCWHEELCRYSAFGLIDDDEARAIIQRTSGITYLEDSEVTIEGLRIYG